jgi:hypothetical protein
VPKPWFNIVFVRPGKAAACSHHKTRQFKAPDGLVYISDLMVGESQPQSISANIRDITPTIQEIN